MIPAGFRLYDLLCCCATAVDEAGSGRDARAEAAWLEAGLVLSGLFPPGGTLETAAGVILGACAPDRAGQPWRAGLWNALDAMATVTLAAGGDRETAARMLPGVFAMIAAVGDPFLRGAMTVLMAGIETMAQREAAA